MTSYLGIDIGTSAVKVIIVDATGKELDSLSEPLVVYRPYPGWSEQNPQEWWQAVDKAVSTLAARAPHIMSEIQGIGLSGQMHGLVGLGPDNAPLRNALLWNDTRAHAEAEELDSTHPEFRSIGGNIVMAGFTAPKAVWMARNEPELFSQLATILLPKDYIRFCLSGEKISDMSDASGTLWLDIEQRCWSETLLALSGLSLKQMPRLVEGSEASCTLCPELARKWGMKKQVVIAGGAGDNAAAAIGLGLTRPQDGFVSLGTSGVVFTVTDRFAPAPQNAVHAFCHALPECWHQMGVTLAASDCLSWLCDVTGQPLTSLLEQLDASDLEAVWPVFHPYLSGERTPHNNPDARGGFFGLSRTHSTGDLVRSVLQGTAFAIADSQDALRSAGGSVSRLIATGGGAKNEYWLRCIASLTGCDIAVPSASDTGAALGAARLAMLADGADITDVCHKPSMSNIIKPNADFATILNTARKTSAQLYHVFAGLSAE